MAVIIRLARFGKKNDPRYRFAVADSRSKRDGKVIEYIGNYNPIAKPAVVKLDEKRYSYWLSVGAKPSDTVANLYRKNKKTKKQNEKSS